MFGDGRRLGRSDVSGSEPVSPQVPHVVKRINQGLQRAEIHGVRCPPSADVAGKVVSIQKIDANVGKGRKRSENVAVLGSGGAGPDRMQGISASLNPLDFPFWNAPRCLAVENGNLSPDHPV